MSRCTHVAPPSTPFVRPSAARWARLLGLLLLLLGVAEDSTAAAQTVYRTRTNVDTIPTGAEVHLIGADGSATYVGVTPLKRHLLPRGNIRLRFTKEGFEELVQPIEIARVVQTLVFNLQRAIAPAELEFIAADEFTGAEVKVNGEARGKVPLKLTVPPGRHQVVISKDGYTPWSRWLEASEGQRASFDIVLQRAAAAKGSLLVTSNPSGADVRINGVPRGVTPTVIDELDAGPALVEVILADHTPLSQTVTVVAGQRAILDAPLSRARGSTGEIKVLANVDDATVFLNGEEIGRAPVTYGDVPAGSHLIEASSPRGLFAEAQAEVRPGEMTVVRLTLRADPESEAAEVRIAANVPGAVVRIDGGEEHRLPYRATGLSAGTHTFEVIAPGFSPWRRSIALSPGRNDEIVAEMSEDGQVEFRTKDGSMADVFVNGRPIGRTPFVGELPVGTHTVLLQRDDGAQEEFNIAVAKDRVVKVTAAFEDEEPREEVAYRPMPLSARALSANTGHVTAMTTMLPTWAFPIMLEAGGGIGYNMDVGVRFRSAFDVINELELVYKWTFAQARTVAAAVEGGLGGGLGGNERNSFVFRVTAKGSLLIGQAAAITARMGFLVHSDRLGPEDELRTASRDSGIRMYLGLDVEFRVADFMNLIVSLEGDPIGSNRKLYLESFMSDPEPRLYPRLGASFVF